MMIIDKRPHSKIYEYFGISATEAYQIDQEVLKVLLPDNSGEICIKEAIGLIFKQKTIEQTAAMAFVTGSIIREIQFKCQTIDTGVEIE